jgi:hypothetical protein
VASPEITKQSAHTLRSGGRECLILLGEMHDLNMVILSSTPTNENHKSQLGDHPDPGPRKTVTFASLRSAGLIQQNSWSRSPHLLCMATPGLQICEPFALTASQASNVLLSQRLCAGKTSLILPETRESRPIHPLSIFADGEPRLLARLFSSVRA